MLRSLNPALDYNKTLPNSPDSCRTRSKPTNMLKITKTPGSDMIPMLLISSRLFLGQIFALMFQRTVWWRSSRILFIFILCHNDRNMYYFQYQSCTWTIHSVLLLLYFYCILSDIVKCLHLVGWTKVKLVPVDSSSRLHINTSGLMLPLRDTHLCFE